MKIYLYLKTHNKTGLKYLGQTINDPFKYKGSGLRWCNHLKKHGLDVSTEILRECSSYEEVERWGIHYSTLWNVVKSDEFANAIDERGTVYHKPMLPKTQDNSNRRGSFWVTNGTDNRLILNAADDIPEGFVRGRTVSEKSTVTKEKMSKSALLRSKRLHRLYTYVCSFCGVEFSRRYASKTNRCFCSNSCSARGRQHPHNPTGINGQSKIKVDNVEKAE